MQQNKEEINKEDLNLLLSMVSIKNTKMQVFPKTNLKYSPPDISDEEKIQIFKEVLTTWNNKNYLSYYSNDLDLSPMLKLMKTKSDCKFNTNQVKYQMRGFYKYIALLPNKKDFSNIDKITSTQTYHLSTRFIKTADFQKKSFKTELQLQTPKKQKNEDVLPPTPKKRKNEYADDDVPPPKKSKLDSDYIASLPVNVFLMLYNLDAISLTGEYKKQVSLTLEQLNEINNTEIIIKLAKLNLIYFIK